MAVCLVTGGTRGIGLATARTLADDGWNLVVSYARNAAAAEAAVVELRGRGVRAEAVRADLGEPADVGPLFAAADALGPLGALVNNAGVIDDAAPVEAFTAERVRRILDVNVVGLLLACGQAVPRMRAAGGGVIVNVSSRAAQRGGAGTYVDYAASKAAVETITVGLAQEVAADGIRVVAVSPGVIDTDIHRDEEGLAARAAQIPLGRVGRPEEVAAAIRFAVSPEASYLTGTTVVVAGGR